MKNIYLLIVVAMLGCKPEQIVEDASGQVSIFLNHKANGQAVQFDTLQYKIPTGFDISFTRWEYFISGIYFLDINDKVIYKDVNGYYINGRYPDTWEIILNKVPTGNISKIKFSIGLVPEINTTGALPNTPENIGMAWPDLMGGGYHIMKLEGHFKKNSPLAGYTMHLGGNGYQVNLEYLVTFVVTEGECKIEMDIDALEWFKNPHDYDFDIDGNYTMGVAALMQKLTDNGYSVISNIKAP